MAVFILIAACIVLWLLYCIADEFYAIAVVKGFDNRKVFWYCFFFGIIGYLLVIALPDRGENRKA